ncbi:Acetylpolyamine aminohydrolase [Actinomadura rubteroloni]|uniref:Acetylpolyamine aminohydrolase n=1 Tax=Actinomadura rubteroloni TaxID=1926885 RepID=A0A2P4UN79_9ACTN|nr:histone deacetylase family protein [Actinomadura rubteroloni]POM26469.1 Acetylpolyamine aminohydrolase [Actinomadura rubteroloni]
MITIYSMAHRLHDPSWEVLDGERVAHLEKPGRAEAVVDRIRELSLGPIRPPEKSPKALIERVHSSEMVSFLAKASTLWQASGRTGEATPYVWRQPRATGRPSHVDGLIGSFATDLATPITSTTWEAVLESAATAVSGAHLLLAGEPFAFALCRPPGHHAGRDFYGGYCYLNNAALAAELLCDHGQVAIIDIDYHHGNGTQDIFYHRNDVAYVSVHADPATTFPYYSGYPSERGEGQGFGANRNITIPAQAANQVWLNALENAVVFTRRHRPRFLVISIGLDTCAADPLGQLTLRSVDYARIGELIGREGVPTLYVLEGGYEKHGTAASLANVILSHQETL